MRIPITIGSFGGIKGHLVPIWPGMNRVSSAAASLALVAARGGGGSMSPLLSVVVARAVEGGTEPCTDLHAAVQRPGRTQGPLVYSSVANNVTAEETPLAPSSSALHQ